MTASLRNSLHRRNHKERSQLAHRSRLGILEKHKDYVLRARDYHSKKDRITRLRQKAAERNKDEFYFAMNRQKTVEGVHVQDRGNQALPVDIVKVLKSQDENYIRTMRTAGLKKIDKLKSQLTALADLVKSDTLTSEDEDELDESELEVLREAGIIPGPSTQSRRKRKSTSKPKPKHVLFADEEEEGAAPMHMNLDEASDRIDEDGDMGWKIHEPRRSKQRRDASGSSGEAQLLEQRREEARQHRSRLLKELSARLKRDQQLRYAERELEMQKLLMGKGASKKLRGVEKVEEDDDDDDSDDDMGGSSRSKNKKVDEKTWKPRVYKWKVERKR
ncbi:small-subunit processome [Panus rudis PR-1116 ss-1]|nr:small-subunit processome [Panus rudis PR-1116 ss-1]